MSALAKDYAIVRLFITLIKLPGNLAAPAAFHPAPQVIFSKGKDQQLPEKKAVRGSSPVASKIHSCSPSNCIYRHCWQQAPIFAQIVLWKVKKLLKVLS